MAFGQRKSERIHFQHEHIVNLMGVDGTWRRACVLKDISASGARLEVEGSTEVLRSREFFMVLSTTGVAFRRCELVWIDEGCRGVLRQQRIDRRLQERADSCHIGQHHSVLQRFDHCGHGPAQPARRYR